LVAKGTGRAVFNLTTVNDGCQDEAVVTQVADVTYGVRLGHRDLAAGCPFCPPRTDIERPLRHVRFVPKPEVEVVCPTYTAAPGLDSFGAFDVIAPFPSLRAPKWRSVDKRRAALQ
jgi:hypothetical protein